MITTRAPSEPFQLVKVTLEQMLAQVTPHDTWLADEDPTSEVFDWCKEKGVRVCSRRNIEEYHRASWPRRTKCKEGNLAYFYDHYGYRDYDFVVQLDADHVPSSGYLEAMLRPFVDPTLGYVSAPSICDSNAQLSWSARGRLYAEAFVHGPLQAGYSNRFAPLCFGSHYAVRTTALREIGGLGPELAEDHSTTLMMNSFGWDGVHALDAEAHGEGPPTFADCVTQEFQWSRSLMVLFLTELPKHWRWLPLRKKIQFLFCEAWYPLFSVSILIGLLLPTIAIIRAESWVNVSYVQFLLHSLPVFVVFFLIQVVLKNSGALRPKDTPLLSWKAALFMLVRWPWSLWGTLMGIRMALTSQNVTFRVTPKGETPPRSLEWKILVPYIAIVTLPSLLTLSVESAGEASGYFFFVLMAQFFYTVSLILLVYLHFHESRKEIRG